MGKRTEWYVRRFIGQRLRAVRKQRGLSQQKLGELSGLSGKFIGEVERGEKSISIDSLHAIAVALGVRLGQLADVPAEQRALHTEDAEKIFALLSGPYPPEELRRAYNVLRALFGKVS
jgi:transcriptional regulator with XRE-family HTH domain